MDFRVLLGFDQTASVVKVAPTRTGQQQDPSIGGPHHALIDEVAGVAGVNRQSVASGIGLNDAIGAVDNPQRIGPDIPVPLNRLIGNRECGATGDAIDPAVVPAPFQRDRATAGQRGTAGLNLDVCDVDSAVDGDCPAVIDCAGQPKISIVSHDHLACMGQIGQERILAGIDTKQPITCGIQGAASNVGICGQFDHRAVPGFDHAARIVKFAASRPGQL